MNPPRVVITGIGLVNSLGKTLDEFGDGLFAGRSCVVPLEGWEIEDKRFRLGGQIKDFDLERELPGMQAKRLTRATQFSLVSVDRAITDAKLALPQFRRERIGTAIGTAAGATGEIVEEYKRYDRRGARGIGPTAWAELSWSATSTHIANHFGLHGPLCCQSDGCVTGFDTLIWSAQQIQQGTADVMVAGGADTFFHPFGWSVMSRSGMLAPVPNDGGNIPRPFSDDHEGIALVEGGAAVILESETHARLRGARIYGEFLGGVTVNSGTGVFDVARISELFSRVIQLTLRKTGTVPADIDWVCAHAPGHPTGDYAESIGIENGLGAHAFCVPVSSIRGAVGQSFAAGGGWQTASAVLAIQRQQVPPTINFHAPSEGCRLDYVPNIARVARVRYVLINAAGVGGTHSSMIVSAYSR